MTRTLALATLASLVIGALPAAPAAASAASLSALDGIASFAGADLVEKRRRPRVPGGSGCDDPRDLIEHPECRG